MLNQTGNFIISEYDTRIQGWSISNVPTGDSTHYYTFNFDCFFNGVELYCDTTELGVSITMSSEYYVQPLDTWKRYKKFAKDYNIFPSQNHKHLLFPTTPSQGVRIKLEVKNNTNSSVNLNLNLFQFTKLEKVDPTQLQEGEDW